MNRPCSSHMPLPSHASRFIASVWIGSKHFAHQCRQGVDRLPEIHRLCCYPDLEVGSKRDHRPPLTADNTVESVAMSTPGSTRIHTPQTSISIRPRHWPPASVGLADAAVGSFAGSIRTG